MIDVTCAIIRNEEDEILVVQRGEFTDHPMKWEFPGGKVNKGESFEECIVREIQEELSIDVVIFGKLPDTQYNYTNKSVRLIPFICDTLDDMPFLSEHIDFKWINAEKLLSVNFSEADIIVAENYLRHIGKQPSDKPEKKETEESVSYDNNNLKSMVTGMMGTQEAEWIASLAADDSRILLNLIEYSFSDDKKLAFRSSWTLTKVCDRFPEMIYLHLNKLSESLSKITNESVQRSFMRIISLSNLNKIGVKYHGILADFCFKSLRSGFSAIAVKAYAMEILFNLTAIYPELKNELLATINMLHGEESAGIIAKGNQIAKKLTHATE
jgi:8-oxo-dGTP diphosphatase